MRVIKKDAHPAGFPSFLSESGEGQFRISVFIFQQFTHKVRQIICPPFQIGESLADISDLRGNLPESIQFLILFNDLLV